MISERTLRRWRREALLNGGAPKWAQGVREDQFQEIIKLNNKVNKMTQELLDQHLLKKE